MKQSLSLLPGLIASFGFILADRLSAQTFTTLHSFEVNNGASFMPFPNNEGAYPRAGVVLSGHTLYGASVYGGSSGVGTLFKVNTDGTGFTVLHHFTRSSDGAGPRGALLLSGDTLYGMAKNGGTADNGTLFKINTDATGFTTLHHFTAVNSTTGANSDGSQPVGELMLSGNALFGTAMGGGSAANGTVFRINTDGTGFSNLHSFAGADGSQPYAGLVLSSNTLYGTASAGGNSGNGTVFAVNVDGTGFRNLYSFSSTPGPFRPNSDGAVPVVGLVLSGNTLYGTAAQGGSTGNGTLFSIQTDGTGFEVLYSFTAVPDPDNPPYVNEDGATPTGALILSGDKLYGTTQVGGSSGAGTVFAIKTDGTGFTKLHTFTGDDGANPFGTLILSGNNLYGTASSIYASSISISNIGTVFSLSFPPPQLTFRASGTDGVLSWPTGVPGFSYAGYRLQSTVNLGAAAWVTVNSPVPPVILNGRFTLTIPNMAAGTQKFYQLSQ
jgi:uncharacterized repeat protein (TIGR03803 family)